MAADTWADMERLFEAPGGPKYCWCMVWRATPEEARRRDGPSRKQAMRKRVRAGVPVGILAYHEGRPVAWCSIAPRSTYRPLGGPEEAPGENIWSLVCFFVERPLRSRGLVGSLIREAEAYARRGGATILEAYPVEAASPSYRFMGVVDTSGKPATAKWGAPASAATWCARAWRAEGPGLPSSATGPVPRCAPPRRSPGLDAHPAARSRRGSTARAAARGAVVDAAGGGPGVEDHGQPVVTEMKEGVLLLQEAAADPRARRSAAPAPAPTAATPEGRRNARGCSGRARCRPGTACR